MNYVENLMLTQLIKLFKIFKSMTMQSLDIFGFREGFHFEFTSFYWVWILEENLNRASPLVSDPFPFYRPVLVTGPALPTTEPVTKWWQHSQRCVLPNRPPPVVDAAAQCGRELILSHVDCKGTPLPFHFQLLASLSPLPLLHTATASPHRHHLPSLFR
jgi:hypothetical protein